MVEFKLKLQVNFQLYKRRSKVQSNGSFTSRCAGSTWRIACTSISSTSKSLVMNLLMLTMDIQTLAMNFECQRKSPEDEHLVNVSLAVHLSLPSSELR